MYFVCLHVKLDQCSNRNILQNFDILVAILDFQIFSNANCYDKYLIQHYIIQHNNGRYLVLVKINIFNSM